MPNAYSSEFRRWAVELARRWGKPVAQVAKKLVICAVILDAPDATDPSPPS